MFTNLWKSIKRQVIAEITAIIIKLIAMRVIQAATGFFGGGALGGESGIVPFRSLAHGGRQETPGPVNFAENEAETGVPDSKAPGFALGVLAGMATKTRLPRGARSSGGGGGGGGETNVTFEGGINIQFTGPVNLDDTSQMDIILEGMANRLKDKTEIAVRMARLVGDANDEESDRTV